ncbi:hypothetical protein [Caviibacter abscessus]|uniref:hypothetical protein n=1 Tax=Caviibacter abscessus TaxID=1766719 RepID=UPI00082F1CCC|nr:hypothetical protein [Caviibacter abscessus]
MLIGNAYFRNVAFIEDNWKATNSPSYVYCLTDEMLVLIKTYKSNQWKKEKDIFLKSHENLIYLYSPKKIIRKMPDIISI